jgi:hypothetical protein
MLRTLHVPPTSQRHVVPCCCTRLISHTSSSPVPKMAWRAASSRARAASSLRFAAALVSKLRRASAGLSNDWRLPAADRPNALMIPAEGGGLGCKVPPRLSPIRVVSVITCWMCCRTCVPVATHAGHTRAACSGLQAAPGIAVKRPPGSLLQPWSKHVGDSHHCPRSFDSRRRSSPLTPEH